MEVCWWRQCHPKQDVESFGEPAKGKTKGAHSRDHGQPQKILAQWIFNTYAAPCLMCITMQLKLVTWQLKFLKKALKLVTHVWSMASTQWSSNESCSSCFQNGRRWPRRNWVKIQWCRVFQFVETSGENKYDKRPGLNLHSCPSSSFPSLCVFIKRPPGWVWGHIQLRPWVVKVIAVAPSLSLLPKPECCNVHFSEQ